MVCDICYSQVNFMKTHLLIGTSITVCLIIAGCSGLQNTPDININSSTAIHTIKDSSINYSEVNSDSDFLPPFGRAENPPPASAGERRLLLARSTDGVHFTASGEVLTDQGNVPDVVVEPNGTIRVYYIAQSVEAGKDENTVTAISNDNGATWTFRKLIYKNWPQPRDPSDPDLVLLDDGTYRMYYTSSINNNTGKPKLGIVYADSPDGITFTYQGIALQSDSNVIDSTTFYYDGLWHMYVLQEKIPGQLHATSNDGITFSLTDSPNVILPLDRYILSNQLLEDSVIRMFGFNLPEANIRAFTSTDGENWAIDDIALEGDTTATLGSNYIQDSSVVQLADGTYLMVYVSEIPLNE